MNVALHVPVDEMTDALESGRRRLSSIDFKEIQDSARSAAMSAFPGAWRRPKPRRRWPFVAAVLVIAAAFFGFMILMPSLRRGPGADLTPEPIEREAEALEQETKPATPATAAPAAWAPANTEPVESFV